MNKEVNHRLVYVPHDAQAAIPSTLVDQELKLPSSAIVVRNFNEYLKENSNQFKTPLVTDPQKIERLKKEQKSEAQPKSQIEESKIILNIETLKNIFHALSWNRIEWTSKASQVVSPAYSPNESINASTEIKKLKNELSSVGINAEKEMIFLVDSQLKKKKKKSLWILKSLTVNLIRRSLKSLSLCLKKIKKIGTNFQPSTVIIEPILT